MSLARPRAGVDRREEVRPALPGEEREDRPVGLKDAVEVEPKEWSEYWFEFSPQTSRGSFSAVSTPCK